MKKKKSTLVSLLSILMVMQWLTAVSQTSPGCTPFIQQKDSVVCPGASVTFSLIAPAPKDSVLPGVWKLLIRSSAIDSNLFNIKPFGFDKANQYLYSIIHKKIIRFDLKNNTVTSVTANNWPGDYTEFVYDYTNKRILCWRGGRDSVYAIPDAGGNWTAIGPGAVDREMFGSSAYWNPLNRQAGLYGGYGFNQMKSWIFEQDGTLWQQRKPNPAIDSMPPKGGNMVAVNGDGTKLYLFSGQGNYSGDELTGTCSLGSPWASSGGMYCWLKDLWELDLSTYQFTNILPVNHASIQYEGALGYYYDKNRFYLFGGYQPTANAVTNQNLPNTNKTFYYRRGIDGGFTVFQGEGDMPPAMPTTLLNTYSYYDVAGKRMIWARYDGIWAYYPDSTLVPASFKSVLWSTGDTSSTITVKPLQNTQYKVIRTIGSQFCRDSINITVTDMKTSLLQVRNICGNSTQLDAGAGFSSYVWSTGATTQTITVNQSATYSVNVGKGLCTATDSSKVTLATPVNSFTVGVLKDSVCAGDADSLFVTAPQTGITYSWAINGNTAVINTGTNYSVKNITGNTVYQITASSNPSICSTQTASAKIIVRTQLPKPVIHADSINNTSVVFRWDAVPGANGYTISFDKGNTFINLAGGAAALSQKISGLSPNKETSIVVRAIGSYTCELSDTAMLLVTTLNPFGDGIYVPNAFTPNGDGVNDYFMVYGTAISSARLIIYNQWGGQVFISTDLIKGWDGTRNGQNAPAGMYTYTLEAVMQDGKRLTKGGTFHLIR